jgi:hypothetical protein
MPSGMSRHRYRNQSVLAMLSAILRITDPAPVSG